MMMMMMMMMTLYNIFDHFTKPASGKAKTVKFLIIFFNLKHVAKYYTTGKAVQAYYRP